MGKKLIVHTDHNNFACKNFNTDKILIQRLILREYGPDIEYIKGEKNIVADALSRFPFNRNKQKSNYKK